MGDTIIQKMGRIHLRSIFLCPFASHKSHVVFFLTQIPQISFDSVKSH